MSKNDKDVKALSEFFLASQVNSYYPEFILGSETIVGGKRPFVSVCMPGRPLHKVEVSFTNPIRSVPTFISFYDKNENSTEEIKQFARALFDATGSTSDNTTQCEGTPHTIFDMTSNFSSYEKSLLVSNIVKSLHPDYQVKLLFVLIEEFNMRQQSEIFALLGNSLNKTVLEASRRHENADESYLKNIQNTNKERFYAECDERLASFIDAITAKQSAFYRFIDKYD